MTTMTQDITIRPKRHRRRYNQIREHVRYVTQRRRDDEAAMLEHKAELRARAVEAASYMAAIKNHLGLPITDDEKEYIDPSFPLFEGVTDRLDVALRYLSTDFSPEKLYDIWVERRWFGDSKMLDWLRIRLAIVAYVEGKENYNIIPSAYYSFKDEDFFFDATRVVNPVGNNHIAWKLLPEPKPTLPRQKFPPNTIEQEVPTLKDWWASIKKFLKSRNPG